jgi:hypothetical protein
MNSRSIVVSLLALGSALFASACTAEVDAGPAGVSGTVEGPVVLACFADGDECGVDADCCSDACVEGVCATPVASCLEDNAACAGDGDCCSGVCAADGYCGYPATVVEVACSADTVACNVDADCCSYVCASDGFCGIPAASCAADNDPCVIDAECCSGLCAADGFCGIP